MLPKSAEAVCYKTENSFSILFYQRIRNTFEIINIVSSSLKLYVILYGVNLSSIKSSLRKPAVLSEIDFYRLKYPGYNPDYIFLLEV